MLDAKVVAAADRETLRLRTARTHLFLLARLFAGWNFLSLSARL
jgi:hypothetical protein